MTFVDQVRESAKSLAEYDGATRAFFEVYHIPEKPAWEDFEQIYTFQQYSVFSSQKIEGLLYEKAEDLTIKRKLRKLNDILFKDD